MDTQLIFVPDTNQVDARLPRISAVIPTYNRAQLISRAIASALSQTCPPSEIIVVDDGSKDNTRDIVAEFGDQVNYIYQENAGSAVARHTGFLSAQHEWVALLDSDDKWNEDHLARIAQAIVATEGRANYYFADMLRDSRADYRTQWQIAGFSIDEPYAMFDEGADFLLHGKKPTMLQATVFKKSAYLTVGGFMKALRYHDDSHLFIKLGLKDPICAVSGIGAVMMDDDEASNRLSSNYNPSKQGKIMKVWLFKDLLDYFGDRLTPAEKSQLSYRLSKAYLGIAKASFREGDYVGSARNVLLSIGESRRPIRKLVNRISTR